MFAYFCYLYNLLSGWGKKPLLPKGIERCVVIVAPHTSNLDLVHMLGAFTMYGLPLRFAIKKSWTKVPYGWIMRPLGAIGIDRKPKNALNMAILENQMGIKSTYYFRAKKNTFKKEIIKKISDLGHEVGYHYESLSDTNGDLNAAVLDFNNNLQKFRTITEIKTCSMHGRPLKPYDNRDIWKIEANHIKLTQEFKILGEVYLDIDYSDIAYINDTGRNWTSNASNRRDKVVSNIDADFDSQEKLVSYLNNKPHPKMVFQIHPERWTDNILEYNIQQLKDFGINQLKKILS